MSHSSQHTLKRKLRASQKAKESRVVRNASRAKFRRVMPPWRPWWKRLFDWGKKK
jgi:hypothetical protein